MVNRPESASAKMCRRAQGVIGQERLASFNNRQTCLLDTFQPDECANYLHNSGYDTW
jgi:hypothetical protein